MMKQNICNGFTLIELSIVLIVIGLIIGGVLVGKDLIRAAEIRAVGTEVEAMRTAFNTFKLKYNAIPGDFSQASAYWSSARDGNGNGSLGYEVWNAPSSAWWFEDAGFHLYSAGLLPNATLTNVGTSAVSKSRTGGSYFFSVIGSSGYDYSGTLYYYKNGANVGSEAGSSISKYIFISLGKTNYGSAAGFSIKDLYNIDKKFDDGYPTSGKIGIRAILDPMVSPSDTCTFTDFSNYLSNTATSGENCSLMFFMENGNGGTNYIGEIPSDG